MFQGYEGHSGFYIHVFSSAYLLPLLPPEAPNSSCQIWHHLHPGGTPSGLATQLGVRVRLFPPFLTPHDLVPPFLGETDIQGRRRTTHRKGVGRVRK